jgi:hypothetical protein
MKRNSIRGLQPDFGNILLSAANGAILLEGPQLNLRIVV